MQSQVYKTSGPASCPSLMRNHPSNKSSLLKFQSQTLRDFHRKLHQEMMKSELHLHNAPFRNPKSITILLLPSLLQKFSYQILPLIFSRVVKFCSGNFFRKKFQVSKVLFVVVSVFVIAPVIQLLHQFRWSISNLEWHGKITI